MCGGLADHALATADNVTKAGRAGVRYRGGVGAACPAAGDPRPSRAAWFRDPPNE